MIVIDEHGTQLEGHAATTYHDAHTELVEIDPLHYVHPSQIAAEPRELRVACAAELNGMPELQEKKTNIMRQFIANISNPDYVPPVLMTEIPTSLYDQLNYLGLIPSDVRGAHVGQSDYSSKLIQPWTIFLDNPDLNYMECDVIKRILRTNTRDSRKQDLTKCKHIIDELIRQIDVKEQHDS